MVRNRNAAVLLLAGIAAAGCAAPGDPAVNTTLYSVNQPVVQRSDYVLDVATTPSGVPETEQARLASWFQSLGLGYGDRVAVDEPRGYESDRVRQSVADVAGSYGILVQPGAPLTEGQVQPGTARVVVSRTVASVPNCPSWAPPASDGPLQTSSNFGCAINSNLAAMIANPNDLVLGQVGEVSGDPATAARAIKVYRNAEPTGKQGLQQTSTTGGN